MKSVDSTGASLLNVFSLRIDIMPKYIRIDTTTVIHLFVSKENLGTKESVPKGNLFKRQTSTWYTFFRTKKRCFAANGYTLNFMVEADGVACSNILATKYMVGERYKLTVSTSTGLYTDEADLDKLMG